MAAIFRKSVEGVDYLRVVWSATPDAEDAPCPEYALDGLWRVDLGETREAVLIRYYGEVYAQLTPESGSRSMAVMLTELIQTASREFRPTGRPEIVAALRDSADRLRQYQITLNPRLGQFDVGYEVGGKIEIHEQGLLDYDSACRRLGAILERMGQRTEKLEVFDPVVRTALYEAQSQALDVKKAAILAETTQSQEKADQDAKLADAKDFLKEWNKQFVKAPSGSLEIEITQDDGSPARETHKGWIVRQWLGVYKIDTDEYRVTHLPTGLACSQEAWPVAKAKTYATVLALRGNWSFTTPAAFPADLRARARRVCDFFRQDDWVGLHDYLTQPDATANNF